ncbi:sulfurtransferase TusA family protein [Azotosporobacter soli]|uniref:sulfurtransferase TusA family protein n=1 Tax=Azotosporobacter soli TaxID=3055040 RepID=UPI0031FE8458
MNEVLDLRGLSCPIPLLRTKEVLAYKDEVKVLVDEVTPRENILKFARSQGCQTVVLETGSSWQVTIRKA